jgi:hypothetical protein
MADQRVLLALGYYPSSSIGRPLAGAKIYIGTIDLDPTIPANQITVNAQQESGAIVAVAQPIRTNAGGVPVYNGSPVVLLVDGDYSMAVHTSGDVPVYYVPKAQDTNNEFDSVEFSLTAAVVVGEGELGWNATSRTLDLGLPGGVVMQIGQELPLWVKNVSGVTIGDGKMAYVFGSTGANLTVKLADASNYDLCHQIGMVTTPGGIAHNGFGFVVRFGAVRGLDASGVPVGEVWVDGTQLYLSATTPGGVTDTLPGSPHFTVAIGLVVSSHAVQGVIGVDPRQPHSADVALGGVTPSDKYGSTQKAISTFVAAAVAAAVANVPAVITFSSGDATPSVLGGWVFKTAASNVITTFDDGIDGQRITVWIQGAGVDFKDGATLVLLGGADWNGGVEGDTIEFVYIDAVWYETSRSVN